MRNGYVYIITNKPFGTLYIGVTSNLIARIHQHRNELIEGFSRRYGLKRLVYFEIHDLVTSAIQREKQLKEWQRNWKLRLIMEMNPEWNDLYDGLIG
jgi:putative endonuclease